MAKTWRGNRNNGVKKGLFLNGGSDLTLEDIEHIAKKEALNIGFNDKALLRIRHAQYLAHLEGWVVVVQSVW